MKFSLKKNQRASIGMIKQNMVCENAKVQGYIFKKDMSKC
jgi:hypothetical protein